MRISPWIFSTLCVAAVSAPAHAQYDSSAHPATFAVIGDTPYGATQVTNFPSLVSSINADPDVQRVVHVGDIKNGSTRCDDSYYDLIAGYFTTFDDGLVYTPGDNEWTDCHRSNNGKYDPLDRLHLVRSKFFSTPNVSLGGVAEPLWSQTLLPGYSGLPENQAWVQARTVFATFHVVGSRNNLAPWFGDNTTDEFEDDPERRLAEVAERTRAALVWIDLAFHLTTLPDTQGIVLFMQADTWPGGADDGFSEILQRIAQQSVAFGKPVLVVQGDTHVYKVDQPLLTGDSIHGIDFAVPNLTRLVVQGETISEWLKLTVDPTGAELFTWERKFL